MTSWVRLWLDMPTDPKWRVIARKSGQPLPCVIALFTLMLTEGGKAAVPGTVAGLSIEDAAAALDMDEDAVSSIIEAMQGRVVSEGRLAGWEKRQPASDRSYRPAPSVWAIIRAAIFERDNYTCRYCGIRGVALQCDHVIPASRGGSHDDDNLVTACKPCNQKKHNRTADEMGWTV